ncbi:MAG TPA: hypothetical protein VEG37_10930 [Burkholderiales bacterium]|nr:hypothetical protein [Burkholderiales bacterium]
MDLDPVILSDQVRGARDQRRDLRPFSHLLLPCCRNPGSFAQLTSMALQARFNQQLSFLQCLLYKGQKILPAQNIANTIA